MQMFRHALFVLCFGLVMSLSAPNAHASQRRFTYTYGSDVLTAGALEFEPWTTYRFGRDNFYSRLDHRLEFEVGLTDRLQSALYFNFKAVTQDEDAARVTEFEWGGISWEWKYKVLDAVADPVGFAVYFEPTMATHESEVEAKLIVDKRLGDFYVAFNAVVEHEWIYEEQGETERELVVELDLGAAWFLTSELSAGVEVRNHTFLPEGKLASSALFAGPAISYATGPWWVTMTVLPQLPALKKNDTGSTFILDEHERFAARLLVGFDL